MHYLGPGLLLITHVTRWTVSHLREDVRGMVYGGTIPASGKHAFNVDTRIPLHDARSGMKVITGFLGVYEWIACCGRSRGGGV